MHMLTGNEGDRDTSKMKAIDSYHHVLEVGKRLALAEMKQVKPAGQVIIHYHRCICCL
jgi:hypothetical protein